MLNRFLRLLTPLLFGVAVAGCNTIEGAGKDVKAAGGAVEKAAKSTKILLSHHGTFPSSTPGWSRRSIAPTSTPTRSSRSSS